MKKTMMMSCDDDVYSLAASIPQFQEIRVESCDSLFRIIEPIISGDKNDPLLCIECK